MEKRKALCCEHTQPVTLSISNSRSSLCLPAVHSANLKLLCSVATAEDGPSSLRSKGGVGTRESVKPWDLEESQGLLMVSQPVPFLPIILAGEARPPQPFSSHGGHQEPLGLRAKLGVGCSPNWPACHLTSRGNSGWPQPPNDRKRHGGLLGQ